MNGIGRHASRAAAGPAEAVRARRQRPAGGRRSLLGAIAGVGHPARRLSVTALAAGAVAFTAIAAAIAASGSPAARRPGRG